MLNWQYYNRNSGSYQFQPWSEAAYRDFLNGVGKHTSSLIFNCYTLEDFCSTGNGVISYYKTRSIVVMYLMQYKRLGTIIDKGVMSLLQYNIFFQKNYGNRYISWQKAGF